MIPNVIFLNTKQNTIYPFLLPYSQWVSWGILPTWARFGCFWFAPSVNLFVVHWGLQGAPLSYPEWGSHVPPAGHPGRFGALLKVTTEKQKQKHASTFSNNYFVSNLLTSLFPLPGLFLFLFFIVVKYT